MDTKFEDIVTEIKGTVDLFPENIAIIEDGIPTLTYRKMWEKAACIANSLKEINSTSEYVTVSPPEKVVFLRSILAYAAILGDTRQKSDPVKIFSKIIAMQPNAPLRGLKRANIGL